MKIIAFFLALSLPLGSASLATVSSGLVITSVMVMVPAQEAFAGKKERRKQHRKKRRKHAGKAANKHRRHERRERHQRHERRERRERRRDSARQAVGFGVIMAARKYNPEYQR